MPGRSVLDERDDGGSRYLEEPSRGSDAGVVDWSVALRGKRAPRPELTGRIGPVVLFEALSSELIALTDGFQLPRPPVDMRGLPRWRLERLTAAARGGGDRSDG